MQNVEVLLLIVPQAPVVKADPRTSRHMMSAARKLKAGCECDEPGRMNVDRSRMTHRPEVRLLPAAEAERKARTTTKQEDVKTCLFFILNSN